MKVKNRAGSKILPIPGDISRSKQTRVWQLSCISRGIQF